MKAELLKWLCQLWKCKSFIFYEVAQSLNIGIDNQRLN